MRRLIGKLGVALCVLVGFPAVAMDMKLEGDRLYLSSTQMSLDDWVKYRELVRGKSFNTVVLINQPGGAIATAISIAGDLIERGVTTVVAGRCLSACTILFLAGKERLFSSHYPIMQSVLGFHSSYDLIGGSQTTSSWAKLYTYYKSRLGDSFDLDSVINRAITELSLKSGFAYFYHPTHRADGSFCLGSIEKPCESLLGKNATSLRLITREILSDAEIPISFLPKNDLFGLHFQTFDKLESIEGKKLACAEFPSDCVEKISQFDLLQTNRAVALSPSKKGFGLSFRYNNIRSAVRRAMFQCVMNHETSCYLGAVNDHVTSALYKISSETSKKYIDELASLTATMSLDDPAENQELPMRGLRAGSYSAPTPEKIDGVKEIKTKDVVEILTGKNKVAFVDVGCGDSTIPSASCIFGGGLASTESRVDSDIEKYLLVILKDISPEKKIPVVFFCSNSLCWLSANAAYRAAKAGYTVYWYRGGINAWSSKKLPLVPTTPIGAVMKDNG